MMTRIKANSQKNIESTIKKLYPFETINVSNDYIYIKIKKNNNVIIFYTNLTVTIEGEIIDPEIKNIFLNELLDEQLYIGSDEVGVGEGIGPIIACAATFKNLDQKKEYFFKRILDSKDLTYEQVQKLGKELEQNIYYKCSTISTKSFNEQNKKEGINIKVLNTLVHNKIHLGFEPSTRIHVIDEFVSKNNFFAYLKKTNQQIMPNDRVIFEPKAEHKYLEVAAASILAKYFFNLEIINTLKLNGIDISKYIKKNINYNLILNDLKNDKINIINKNNFIKEW